jgi:hypothetical protein
MESISLSVPIPTLTLYTDASNLGWGAYLEGSWALGLWSPLQQKEHINLLEMKAVHLALSHFRTTLHLKSLVLATDNTTIVAYLKNQGGTHCFSLYSLCREILLLCSELQIQLVVRHIPGHLNVLADTLSRSLAPVNSEWELLQVIFNAISLLWGRPHLDLFATSLNHKLDTFVSPVSDPLAYAVDAMSISCKGMFAYAFPPFRFLSQVLQKVARESCKTVCKTTSSSSQSESTVSAERKNNASKSREPASAHMVTLRKGIRQKGFSVGATNHISKAVRQSTEIVYDAKWSIFVNWCVGREIDLIKVSVEQLRYFFCTSF